MEVRMRFSVADPDPEGLVLSNKLFAILWIALILAVVSFGCKGDEFCCLYYDLQTSEQDYCYAHSRAAGHFLLDAKDDSEASLQIALSQLRQLIADVAMCDSVPCIERFIETDPGLAGLWSRYRDEHYTIESKLVCHSLSEIEKCYLICCGFIDAYQRIKENIENDGVTM
jgi:hypothetical protein